MGTIMKKLLLSTALLSTVAIAYSTNTAEAAPFVEQKTDIGVKFKGETNEETGNGVGNIVMGKSPTEWKFADLKTSLSGGTTQLEDQAKRVAPNYVMVNDDRAAGSTGNPQTPWTLSMKFNKLQNGTETLNSKLTLTMGEVYNYFAGDIINANTPDENYPFPEPAPTAGDIYDLSKATAGVKSDVANKSLTLDGGADAVPVLQKALAGLDPEQANQNMGNKKGGQGYLVSFSSPVLSIQDSTADLAGETYSSELVYSLDLK